MSNQRRAIKSGQGGTAHQQLNPEEEATFGLDHSDAALAMFVYTRAERFHPLPVLGSLNCHLPFPCSCIPPAARAQRSVRSCFDYNSCMPHDKHAIKSAPDDMSSASEYCSTTLGWSTASALHGASSSGLECK